MMSRLKALSSVCMGVLCAAAFGANPARPGTVNYIEGAAYLAGKPLNAHDVGSIDLGAGQVLTTVQGKAEILLTPGVFLRLDDNSAVKMISPDLTYTKVDLERGSAAVEVDEIYQRNNLQVVDGGVSTQLLNTGYYEFNANNSTEKVFQGKAAVETGDGKYTVVKGHHEFTLGEGAAEKPVSFNTHTAEGELYNWSSLRSQYLAEANNQIAGAYAGAPGFYPGWYWDSSAWNYTFIGSNPFWSPFGFGFYPPGYGGFYGGGLYGGGFYGGGFYRGGFYNRGFGRGRFNGGGIARGGVGGGFHGGGGRR